MYKTLSAPIMIQWEVTPSCNHQCIYCYNYWRPDNSPQESLPHKYNKLYHRVVTELINNQVFMVVITGGEPLIVLDQISPYIKQLVENNITVLMNSNLTLLTREKAQLLKENGVKSILGSFPSANPETCDFLTSSNNSVSKIINGIKTAHNANLPVAINMVVSKINLKEIEKTAQVAASLGVKKFAASRASNPTKDSPFQQLLLNHKEFRQMLKTLDEVRSKYDLEVDTLEANPPCAFNNAPIPKHYKFCSAATTTCTIGSNGEIRPCNRLPSVYGSIKKDFLQAWSSMNEFRSDQIIPDECSSCKLKLICKGGCKADALIAHDSIYKPDPFCDFQTQVHIPSKKKVQTTNSNHFTLNPSLQIREEQFGSIAYVNIKHWTAIDPNLTLLFTENPEVIKLNQLASTLSTNLEEARSTASVLVDKKILLPS